MPEATAATPKEEEARQKLEATLPSVEEDTFHRPRAGLKLAVPGAKRKPKNSLVGSMVWLYGAPKIGKTTLASCFPGTWFVATEPGQDWVEVREPTLVGSWDEFLEWCAFVEQEKPTHFEDGRPIKTLCIDTVDYLYKMCFAEICSGLGVEDPGELSHGKGWGRLNNEFERVMSKIRRWPYGLITISHERQKEFKTRGRKIDRWEPAVGAAAYRWCQSAADLILRAYSDEMAIRNEEGEVTGDIAEQRLLLCHPTSYAVAGGRMSDRLPEMIKLDYGELTSYFPDTQ
jgi:hypothetical protein